MRPLFTFILLVLSAHLVRSQYYYHFETLTEQSGLSDNRVTCFLKDRTGFLWIGTANGLNRYDGFQFRVYRPGNKHFTLSHEHINALAQDQQGRLWVATWSGLNVLNIAKDSLHIFTSSLTPPAQSHALSNSLIWDVYADAHNRIWIAPDARDLCYYDVATRTFTCFPWREFVHTVLPGRSIGSHTTIKKIIRKSDHELWLGTTAGLFSFDMQQHTFAYHGGDDAADFTALYYAEKQHKVFLGQNKLYVFHTENNRLNEIQPQSTSKYTTSHNEVILLPTGNGLWRIDPDTEEASPLLTDDSDPFSMQHETITDIFTQDDITWIGTSAGVKIYDEHTDLFPFTPVFTSLRTPAAGSVYHVLDAGEELPYYVSSYTHNAWVTVNKENGEATPITTLDQKPLQKCSYTFQDSKHRLWILTSRSVFVSDSAHQHFTTFPFPRKEDEYLFHEMIEDAAGNFWFASMRFGVFKYTAATHEWKQLTEKEDGLVTARPTALLSDPKHHAVWIGDYGTGVFRYDLKTKKFTNYTVASHGAHSLRSSLVNDLTADNNGNIWIATTSGGISKFSYNAPPDKSITTYSIETGLPENTIYAVQSDLRGNIWLASFKGLTCISGEGKVIHHYDKANGLPFSNLTNAITRNNAGELLTGAGNGFIRFHPDSLVQMSAKFPVVITRAQLSDSIFTGIDKPVFSHRQNELMVEFAALTYTLPQQVRYYYKLDGFDTDWIDAGNIHHAHYINLGDGIYTFQVKAVDPGGRESSNIASIQFTITPPFWKEWWFITVIVSLSVYGLYSWIISLQRKLTAQKILNQFATSLYHKNTVNDVFWTVAINCVELLKFQDCVVYLMIRESETLVQKAAAGPKSMEPFRILNPIEIELGKGIVGTVAKTGKAELIHDTSKDRRYIVDDQVRLSELTVPIMVDGKVFGIIDSEHPQKNFYKRWHLHMVQEIAAICSAKISRYFVEEQIRSKVARDLHDDMGSTLSSIKIMSNIALEKRETEAAQHCLRSIRENAALMQESMSDIVWAINPENDSLEKVIIRMKEFAAEILEPLDIYYEFIEDGDFATARLDLNVRKDFYLIFKEAINNAAKYSQCKKLIVHLTRFAQGIRLRISDDGIGFDKMILSNGNGLKNMRYRAETIHAVLQIESVPQEGTSIFLRIPLT
ncbi:MAG TPA: two-component regulator propeller domain-containing protein [Ohtaekwangia sp.]|uniref:two-component regulator propeller domain-containing protein n=1 Tax=Ohtaekwangia sp. TaxID=2066019 RepID=UPI002F923CCA